MKRLHLPGLIILLIVNLVCRINAQFASSAEILILDGTSTNWNGDFFVGFDDLTRNVTLIATNGASLCVTNGSSFLGYSLNSNSNVAFIVGNGTRWTNSNGLFVGEKGAYNRVTLADGARLLSENGQLGSEASARMNAVAVTGPNSVWSNSATLTVGNKGMFNHLKVVDGGTVYSADGTIGTSSTSNTVLVTGQDSAWHCQDLLYVGYRASDNRLTIDDNGLVSCATLYVGDYACSYNLLTITNGGRLFCNSGDIGLNNATGNNAIWITGTGSVLSNANKFSMGSADKKACRLTIDRGGAMYSKNGDVAAGTAWVSDAGSIWKNDGYLYVRSPGLVVTNGGRVESVSVRVASGDDRSQLSVFDGGIVQSSTYGQIGYGYTAQSNTGLVSGAGSLWTNGTSLAVGDYGQSNLLMIVNGGLVVSQSGTIGTSDNGAIGNRVEISGDGSLWRTLEGLTINNRGKDNVLLMRDGGVAAVGGNVTVKTGGYVTNYVTGLPGGLDLSESSSLTVDGRITIRFDAPPVSDTMHYWGLRWAGNHADALKNLLNSGSITVEDGPALPVRWHGQASVYFSEPYTYIGFDPASVLFPGTLLLVR